MLNDAQLDKLVEDHWKYTEQLIRKSLKVNKDAEDSDIDVVLDIMHFLYEQAFKHGWKHRDEESN